MLQMINPGNRLEACMEENENIIAKRLNPNKVNISFSTYVL